MSVVLLAIFCIPHFTAWCDNPPREYITLALWRNADASNDKSLGEFIRLAQQSRPNLVINIRLYPAEDAYRQILEWCQPGARDVPDLFTINDLWLPQFAASIEPLNAHIQAREFRQIPDAIRERLRYEGSLYGVPWLVNSRVLYYREDLLETAGVLPPRTWEEVVTAARRIYRPPTVYGFALPGLDDGAGAELLTELIWAHDGELPVTYDAGQFNLQAFNKALAMLHDIQSVSQPEVLSWGLGELEDQFVQGKVAMLVSDRSFQARLEKLPEHIDYGIAALPVGSKKVGHINVDLLCTMRGRPNRDAAISVLKCALKIEGARSLLKLGGLPSHTEIIAEYEKKSSYAPFLHDITTARGLPAQRWEKLGGVLDRSLYNWLSGRMNEEQIFSSLKQDIWAKTSSDNTTTPKPTSSIFGD